MSKKLLCAAACVLTLSLGMNSAHAEDAAMNAYKQSMEKMDADMQKGMDPDATKAYARMMIAHHQGAVDMSHIVLKDTKDSTIRKMADKTIEEQQKEIGQLKEWLSKHDK